MGHKYETHSNCIHNRCYEALLSCHRHHLHIYTRHLLDHIAAGPQLKALIYMAQTFLFKVH